MAATTAQIQHDCALCAAVSDKSEPNGQPRAVNHHLLDTPRFVVMACIGPLVPGHVIVVSRAHFPSLASMGEEAIVEYEQLASRIVAMRPFDAQGALEAEHGSTFDDCAGACVAHTHVHWLPGFAHYSMMFEGILSTLTTDGTLPALATITAPYLFLRGTGETPQFYEATELPSQFIRQAICGQLGRDDWDWRHYPQNEWIEQTLAYWQSEKHL